MSKDNEKINTNTYKINNQYPLVSPKIDMSNPILIDNYLNQKFTNSRQAKLWGNYVQRHLSNGTTPWEFEKWSNNNFVKNALESNAAIDNHMVTNMMVATTGILGKYLGGSVGEWYANDFKGNILKHIDLNELGDELGKGVFWEGFKEGVVVVSPKHPYVIGAEIGAFMIIDFSVKLRNEIKMLDDNNILNSYNLGIAYKKALLDGLSGIPVKGGFIQRLGKTFGMQFTIGFLSENQSYNNLPSDNSKLIIMTHDVVLPVTKVFASVQDGVLFVYNIKENFKNLLDDGHEDQPISYTCKDGIPITDYDNLGKQEVCKWKDEEFDKTRKQLEFQDKVNKERREFYSNLSEEEIMEQLYKLDEIERGENRLVCNEFELKDYLLGKINVDDVRETTCWVYTKEELNKMKEDFNNMTLNEKVEYLKSLEPDFNEEEFRNQYNDKYQDQDIDLNQILNEKNIKVIEKKYDNKYDIKELTVYIGVANEILNEIIYLKHWKEMSETQRRNYVLGTILIGASKLPSISSDNEAVCILQFMGNAIRSGDVDVKDILILGVQLADVDFPLTDVINLLDGIIKDNSKEIEESMVFLMLDLLAMSNPFFAFVKGVIVCVKFLDRILTKQSVVNIKGVEALQTTKITFNWWKDVKLEDALFHPFKFLASLFKRKVKIDNDFFGAHGRGKGKHTHEARERAIKDFINQLMYKVFQVIGLPYEFMDLGDPKNRLESFSRMIRIKDSLDKWFEVNGKHLSKDEKEAILKTRTLSEEDKEYIIRLHWKGLKPSWYFNHKSENPITFFNNLIKELKNVKNIDIFFHDLYNLFVPQKDRNHDLNILYKTAITPDLSHSKEFDVYSQLKFSKSDLDILRRLGLIDDKLKMELENNMDLSKDPLLKRWNDQATKAYEKARDSRDFKDNDELKKWNEKERYEFENHIGKYSNLAILGRVNQDILFEEISIGYIFNTISGCSIGNVSSFLAHLDKNIEILVKSPRFWIKHNFKSFLRNCVISYLSQVICSHLMTIPTILTSHGKDLFSNEALNYMSMGLSSLVSAGIAISNGYQKNMKFKDVVNIGMDAVFESSISNVSRVIIHKTLAGVVIKGVAAKIAIGLGTFLHVSFPPAIIATVLTGATIFIFRRGIMWGIECIKNMFNKEEVSIIKYDTEDNNEYIDEMEILIIRNNRFLNGSILRENPYLNGDNIKNNKYLNGDNIKNNKYLNGDNIKNNKYLNGDNIKNNKYLNGSIIKENPYMNGSIIKENPYMNGSITKNNPYMNGDYIKNRFI
jgi:hypothetical protein